MTSETPRLALIGMGRMGNEIDAVAAARGLEVVARLDVADMVDEARAVEAVAAADVAIEFTVPGATPQNVEICLEAGVPIVVGTTGWYDHLDEVGARVRDAKGGLLYSPNYSVGVALLRALVERAGELLRGIEGFDAQFVDWHHAAKQDAPSGTGLMLQDALASKGLSAPIQSIRLGHMPGRHELCIDGTYEQVVLSHDARSRRVFADGAVTAALWLRGRTGVFTMDDVLGMGG